MTQDEFETTSFELVKQDSEKGVAEEVLSVFAVVNTFTGLKVFYFNTEGDYHTNLLKKLNEQGYRFGGFQ